MGVKKCDKCDEVVDESKAFCPGCGHAFVDEEQRQDVSGFDKLDHTVQLGQTMYNQMLSDMGLNISKASEKPEQRAEVVAPIEAVPAGGPGPPVAQKGAAGSSKIRRNLLWAVGLLVLLPIAVAAVIILARAVLARY